MTMYFRDEVATRKFIALCNERAIVYTLRQEGPKFIVTANVPRGARSKFVSAWAARSMDAPWTRKPAPQLHFDFTRH